MFDDVKITYVYIVNCHFCHWGFSWSSGQQADKDGAIRYFQSQGWVWTEEHGWVCPDCRGME